MIKSISKNIKKEKISLFIYPTYHCLGNCLFCYLDTNAKLDRKELMLSDIKENIVLLEKKYSIDDVVVMGGEPLLWNEINSFLEFMSSDFFKSEQAGLIISTEALQYSSPKLANYFKEISFRRKPHFRLQVPINHFRTDKKVIKQRKEAIINLAQRKIPVRYILFFCNDKSKSIEDTTDFLKNIYLNYYKDSKSSFFIELRVPFNFYFPIFASPWKQFGESFLNVSNVIIDNNIPLLLRNIPFCYLNRKELSFFLKFNFRKRRALKYVKINKKGLLKFPIKIEPYDTNRHGLSLECVECALKNRCNGIDPIYIKNFNYQGLKPFKY